MPTKGWMHLHALALHRVAVPKEFLVLLAEGKRLGRFHVWPVALAAACSWAIKYVAGHPLPNINKLDQPRTNEIDTHPNRHKQSWVGKGDNKLPTFRHPIWASSCFRLPFNTTVYNV